MEWQDTELTKCDFTSSDYEVIVSKIAIDNFIGICSAFCQKAIEAKESGDKKTQAIFSLLTILSGFELDSSSVTEPFSYTRDLELISDQHLGALRDWALEVSNLQLKARIADALWFRKREPKKDHKMAQIAVDCHLEISKQSEGCEWLSNFNHIERAFRLAKSINYRESDVITYIEELLDKSNQEDRSFLPARLMELLQDSKEGDATKLVVLSENFAKKAEAESDWHRARSYWEVTTRWHQILKDDENVRLSWLSFSETYMHESQSVLNSSSPSYLTAAHFLDQAITSLRKTSDTKERVDELCRLRLSYGEKTHKEMILFSQTVNISDATEKARKIVEGKTLEQAVFSLALSRVSPSVTDLRKRAQETIQAHPLRAMSPMQIYEKGRVTARQPSMFSSDPKEVEDATLAEMFNSSMFDQHLMADSFIEPARYQINLEHHVTTNDWLPIVFNSPFVPMNREYIFAEGLDAGLKGNFMIAAHLLIPQVENSMRVLLNQFGINTTSYNAKGIQDEDNINTFYRDHRSTLEKIFGKDMTFDFEGLLISRYGMNLRNRMAHGLIDHGEFTQSHFSYLWWLILRAVRIPIINHFSPEVTYTSTPE